MKIAIIGGGPAGLRAAEIAAERGAAVTLFEGKPSVGRKFLVAGRGGLNLSKEEPLETFLAHFSGPPERWRSLIGGFDTAALRAWAGALGIETFTASTGRIYPRELKAAPLLRRWVEKLRRLGVQFAVHHRWTGLQPGNPPRLSFTTPNGPREFTADAVILALGGASWPGTGSDGAWTEILARLDVEIAPFQPANCGWEVAWPAAVLAAAEGQPLKNLVARAGNDRIAGELLLTRYGLEGGALYQLTPSLRHQPTLHLDFKPDQTAAQLTNKLASARGDLIPEAQKRWRLSSAATAILANQFPNSENAENLAELAKNCPIPLLGPRPLAEAISTAGGISWRELDENLMLQRHPGIYVCGEMLDWEAPTGGYLLHGCLATATRAATATTT